MLSRATYPEIWSRNGYPPKPTTSTIVGNVVHQALEALLRSFRDQECTSLDDELVVSAIRQLGGYTKLVERVADEELQRLNGNPRFSGRIDAITTSIRLKIPELRLRVQALVSRTKFQPGSSQFRGAMASRGPLSRGSHPEVELQAKRLGMTGRADLVSVGEDSCEITDFKTGEPDSHHVDQLFLYALLWMQDSELNPRSLPVRRLTISYSTHDIDVAPPSLKELQLLAAEILVSISGAESAIQLRPPTAKPEFAMCRRCSVRQLCDAYWISRDFETSTSSESGLEWFDFEGVVLGRHGARSWTVSSYDHRESLLVRTATESVPFDVGDRIRMLDLHKDLDHETELQIATMTSVSEIFLLTSPD
jgi:hypothetical protein